MHLKGIALFVAIYGHGALAALPDSCEEGDDTSCSKCTPLNTEFEPAGVGEVWYSYCCTDSETTTADPPVTTTKKYCYSYSLVGFPNNQYSGNKPSCDNTFSAIAWSLHGQCQTASGATDPYTPLAAALNGCPGEWNSSTNYEVGDTVDDDGVVYRCSGAAQFCSLYGPDLRGVGAAYWIPVESCTGTAAPTEAPTFLDVQAGCPEEFDSSTTYEANDSVSITRDDGTSIIYRCKAFPESQWCNDDAYSPLNTEKLCNGGPCWPRAWIKQGACTGTFTPTATPTFDSSNIGGCPEAYDESADYGAGDKVSITPSGEDYGKIYQCKSWPNSGYCGQEAYSPANTEKGCNGEVCWPDAWTYIGGCTGTISPTATPTFDSSNIGGCPEAYDESADYEAGDKMSVTPSGEDYGKIYQCKSWPNSGYCGQEAYSPANTEKGCNGEVCWPEAWTYIGGCTGTISPTATPTFDANVGGCPAEYDESADYEAGDKMSITPAGEDYGKIYQCKSWPNSGYCGDETYSPANTEKGCNGEVCWPTAWTYVGGCTGTIAPTGAPVFTSLAQWDKQGCPDEYVANNPNYKPGDYVSVPKNDDNTYGVVWMCKNAMTAPWCQNEGYAPGSQYGGQAWEKVGYCDGTMSPTTSPVAFTDECQFKYNLETTDDGAYVVLQAGSWVKGGSTVSTGGTALDLYKAGHLVRYGDNARKCKAWPYTGYCEGWSPFIQDSPDYNPLLSPKGWEAATCEAVGAGADDTFIPSVKGPVFASNGKMLVNKDGECQTGVATTDATANDSGATNPGDYFKPSPTVKGCQQCPADEGLDSLSDPKVCITCPDGTGSEIVNGKSVCVCDNGASNPWAADADHCKSCPGGKRYLGNVDNTDGDGTCEPCPTGLVYTSRVNGSDTFKLCCKDSGCSDNGHDNILSECFDGTTAKTFCVDADINVSHAPTDVPSLKPSLKPSSMPSLKPSSMPSLKPSSMPSLKPSGKPV